MTRLTIIFISLTAIVFIDTSGDVFTVKNQTELSAGTLLFFSP